MEFKVCTVIMNKPITGEGKKLIALGLNMALGNNSFCFRNFQRTFYISWQCPDIVILLNVQQET